jgi:starvation-inducible DNA-binding protein
MSTTLSGVPKALATPSDLPVGQTRKVADALNPLVADTFALYVKVKNYHWHVSGSHYRDYHLLLDEQAGEIFLMTDVLAERVRKLGGTTIRSIGHIARLSSVKDDGDEFVPPHDMLWRLIEDNKALNARFRAAHKVADENGDVATASILENYIDETERRVWFLYETAVGAQHTN